MNHSVNQKQHLLPGITEAMLTGFHTNQKTFTGILKSDPSLPIMIRFDQTVAHPDFSKQLEAAVKYLTTPFAINLLDTTFDSDGVLTAGAYILLPDYLVDVTSISGCFIPRLPVPEACVIEKFKERRPGMAALAGNIVNSIMDQLIQSPKVTFPEILRNIFKWYPVDLSFLSDAEVAQLVQLIKPQFYNLEKIIRAELPKYGIERSSLSIEPSFYSRVYGIQGRLDVLCPGTQETPIHIIEVKSGKIFQPNLQGINPSHYIQTVLYHLLICSVYHPRLDPLAYILYSRDEKKPLRHAETDRSSIYQSLWIRNSMVLTDFRMMDHAEIEAIISETAHAGYNMEPSFLKKDWLHFTEAYHSLTPLEKSYFNHQCAFISTEKWLTKTMYLNIDNPGALYADTLSNRNTDNPPQNGPSFLEGLTILENKAHESDPILILGKKPGPQDYSTLKSGELAIFFPTGKLPNTEGMYMNQVFKCTILSIHSNHVTIKLRKSQHNPDLFVHHTHWSLTAENPENGYQAMYQSLAEWTNAPKAYRDLILGSRPPLLLQDTTMKVAPFALTETQHSIFCKALQGTEYFLIWGPPGTGKTHIMLRAIAEYLITQTTEKILLLAYANRAVDEICGSLMVNTQLFGELLIRIGSRQATSVRYHGFLLDAFLSKCTNREEVRHLIQNKRIYTATISSISNKREIFRYTSFETVIIDEASQIPESMLCGLLKYFKKVILIGDHRQLPAVVIQPKPDAPINSPDLLAPDMDSIGNSLFERLFRKARKMGWHHAYGLLNEQGRMHIDIMEFANQEYYESLLQPLPGLKRQFAPMYLKNTPGQDMDLRARTIFINTTNSNLHEFKTNTAEAETCAKLVNALKAMYHESNKELHKESIGIITPFRAQSDLIYQSLCQNCADVSEQITVDTVERYQGSARDIIIISSCINQPEQLHLITSISSEGIDRKLNVATTRAREQLILLGNRRILELNPAYKKLIAWMEKP